MISGVAVRRSPWEGLAKALSTGVAGYAEGQADRLETADTEARQKKLAEAMLKYQSDPIGAAQMLMESPSTAEYGLKIGIPALSAGTSSVPAPMQIANQMYQLEQTMNNPNISAKDRYEAQRQYNLLGQSAKTYGFDRGTEVNGYTPEPYSAPLPVTAPMTPPVDNLPTAPADLPKPQPVTNADYMTMPPDLSGMPQNIDTKLPTMQFGQNENYTSPQIGSIAGYDQTMANREAMKAGAAEQAKKDVALGMNAPIKRAEAAASEIGKAEGEAAGAQAKKVAQAPNLLDLIAQAKEILPQATSGTAEAGLRSTQGVFGYSSESSQADKQLNVISAALTGAVPRFEGPQGVLDVQLYKQAAGDIGNRLLPTGDRLAALEIMEKLNQKYASQASNGAQPKTGKTDYKSLSDDELLRELQ
jgi:hypothetical protein